MKIKLLGNLLAATAMSGAMIAPMTAVAQHGSKYQHRQSTKNTWRNVAIGSGAVGLYGLLKGNSTLTLLGAAGALYSANRYEQDRKSQSKMGRARASLYGRSSYMSHGHRYVRKTVWRNGQKYYTFVRG